MLKAGVVFIYFLLLAFFINLQTVDSLSHSGDHDQNSMEKSSLFPFRRYGVLNNMNILDNEDELKKILDFATKFTKRQNKAKTEINETPEDYENGYLQQIDKTELEGIPPWLVLLLSNKRKRNGRFLTPRLGRDVDEELDCQRSRPPFAPRLGKKSLPFKPRLGRQAYDDGKC